MTSFPESVGEISVQKLVETVPTFIIPSYQRGYRWQGKQVVALLDDFSRKWENNKEGKYLLQPIVVQQSREEGNVWIVVDGQQRLTTLRILLEVLCEKGLSQNVDKDCIWKIKPIGSANANERLSDACCKNARQKIKGYKDESLKLIANHIGDILLIYYRIESQNELVANDSFERLNAGKIALTDSELIRALYLHDDNQYANAIAAEWEQIETALKDDAFWFMFNNQKPDTPTRMDRLFKIVTAQENKDTSRAAFWSIESGNKTVSNLEDVWNRILNLYWMLRYCYNDIAIYHYVGWFSHRTGIQFKGIYDLYECDRPQFKKNLQRIILGQAEKITLSCDKARADKIKAIFRNVRHLSLCRGSQGFQGEVRFLYLYPPEGQDGLPPSVCDNRGNLLPSVLTQRSYIIDFLLMFNLELLNQKKENISRFSFKSFNNQFWDIEHVASHNPEVEKKPKENAIEQWDKNLVGNLVLLDKSVNRAYKDKPFHEKRLYILGMRTLVDDEGNPIEAFMPPGTLDVFAKNYTDAVTDMEYWYQSDFDAYQSFMVRVFEKMWIEAFSETKRSE